MTQTAINKLWQADSNVRFLAPPVPPTAKTLRRPYQYRLSGRTTQKLVADLQALAHKHRLVLQCSLVDVRLLKYGIGLRIFLLSDWQGATRRLWKKAVTDFRDRLRETFGADVLVYIEAWKPDAKSQVRFETYIQGRGGIMNRQPHTERTGQLARFYTA